MWSEKDVRTAAGSETLKVEEGATSQGMWCPLEAGKGQEAEFPLEAAEGTSPADTLT